MLIHRIWSLYRDIRPAVSVSRRWPPADAFRDGGRYPLGGGFLTRLQVVTLWCFNTVGRDILTLGEGFTTNPVPTAPRAYSSPLSSV